MEARAVDDRSGDLLVPEAVMGRVEFEYPLPQRRLDDRLDALLAHPDGLSFLRTLADL